MPTITRITLTEVEVEEFKVVPDGLQCPVGTCGAINEVVEVDYGLRNNRTEVERVERGVSVYAEDGERDFHTAGWLCDACGTDLAMPTNVTVVYS